MTSLTSLIERVEAATEGSRELDALIAATLKICPIDEEWVRNWTGEWRPINGLVHLIGDYGSSGNFRPLEYTTSIDAALTLLPDGFKWKCGYSRHVPHNAEVIDYSAHTGTFIGESDASRCLALLAAILRARQTEPRHDES